MFGDVMVDTLAYCRTQILSLNTQLINSEIVLESYRQSVEALLLGLSSEERVQFDTLTFL
jgi:hypothetical protein